MSIYMAREGPCATVNVWAALNTLGSSGTVNSIVVPAGQNSIKELWLEFCNGAIADTSGGIQCVKLTGSGLKYGDQFFIIGGDGREVTGNSAKGEGMLPVKQKVEIATNPGGEIWVYGGQYGTDSGTPEILAGLVFSTATAPERYYVIRMAACAALHTETALTANMDQTPGAIRVPSHMHHIYSITTATQGICLVGATGGTSYVMLRGAIKGGEVVMVAGALSNMSTGTGVSGGLQSAVQVPTSIEVQGGTEINCWGVQAGVDWGTPYVAVCVELGA